MLNVADTTTTRWNESLTALLLRRGEFCRSKHSTDFCGETGPHDCCSRFNSYSSGRITDSRRVVFRSGAEPSLQRIDKAVLQGESVRAL